MYLDGNGAPVWHDGDVVRIQFKRKRTTDLSKEYEYVRKDGYWPGDAGWWSNKTDAEMTEAWNENRAALMVMTAVDSPNPEWPNQTIEPGVNGIWCAYHRRGNVSDFVLDGCALFLEELGRLPLRRQQAARALDGRLRHLGTATGRGLPGRRAEVLMAESKRRPPESEESLALIRRELGTAGDIYDDQPVAAGFWAFHALNQHVYDLLEGLLPGSCTSTGQTPRSASRCPTTGCAGSCSSPPRATSSSSTRTSAPTTPGC